MKPIGWMLLLCLFISGCAGNGSFSHQWTVQEPALPVMEKITLQASECWFKSGKGDFKSYRLAPELNSFVDRPRLLLVPYHQPTARPVLVIEASGNPAQISAYGPLLTGKMGKNIIHNLDNWLEQSSQC